MLTRVSVGQVRFNLPGLGAGIPRGVAVGKEVLLRFAALDRVVAFLRLLSAERCPDEVWAGLRVLFARPMGGTREALVRLPNQSGHTTDQVAAAARLAGGACFTGTGRHFVPWRDGRAPLGYDVAVVSHEDGEFMLYGEEQLASFRQEGEMSLERLLLRLELRRRPGGAEAALREADGVPVFVAVRRGLFARLADRLFAAEVAADAALCEPPAKTAFAAAPSFWLFRIPALPPRLVRLLARTPGLDPYLPAVEDVLVAAGYDHPVHLGGCRAALQGERTLLLAPPPRRTVEVAPRPAFSALSDLVRIKIPAAEYAPAGAASRGQQGALEVPLRLEPAVEGPARPRATLVSWEQSRWLRRLLYALPPVAVRSYRVAFLRAGVLVLAGERLEGIPFGQPLEEAGPRVLVPVGQRLRPALSPELLVERLGLAEEAICVFPGAGAAPFRVARDAFEPLERRALARLEVPWAPRTTAVSPAGPGAPPAEPPPEIANDPIGMLPLWGLKP